MQDLPIKRVSWLSIFVYLAGGLYAIIFLFSAGMRLVYPYEVEWNEGAVLDHAIRILDGKPIYTAPSLDFSAFVYTPFYYYVTSVVMKIGGEGLWAGRLVSILSILLSAFLIGKIVRRETSSSMLSVSGAMLFIAFYRLTGFFYDIVRMDSLALCLVVAAIYSALYFRRGHIIGAIFVALAYFTKQQMLFVWPAIALCFALRDRRQLISFAFLSLLIVVAGTIVLSLSTNGWYRFYTYTIPSMKASAGFDWQTALEFFRYWMLGSFGFTTLAILIAIFAVRKDAKSARGNLFVIIACYIMATISGAIGFGNPGGYKNVLMPLAATISIIFPISANIISEGIRKFLDGDRSSNSQISAAIMLLAFLSLAYNPLGQKMLFASTKQRLAGDEFMAKLKAMPGDVWIPYHGYIGRLAGKQTHVHFMAMNDALVPHDTTSIRYQHEIDSSLAAFRFTSIIRDEENVFHWDSVQHYSRSGTIFQTPNVFISRIGDAQTRPQFIYLPNR